ncbi:MAG: hypothetical protein D6695_08120 [Planctomycetota bacterium]|nr:MAG: hypothetical protein D6695_08120 [Planctomycetota bacterium]
MAFATDRDLLVLEPALFREVSWLGQRLVSGTGSASGTALTMSSQDVLFDAAGVGAGHVVLVNQTAYEVIDRVSSTVLTISRLRESSQDVPIPVAGASGAEVVVATFGPQIAMVHRQVMRMLGIEPDAEPVQGEVSEASIINASVFARLEALGALHVVYAGSSSALGPDTPHAKKAEFYRMRFGDERQRAAAMIDLDGDGQPDAVRRLNIIQLMRG